jgi:succinate dehydrogenase / fumarate reductase flavoprotein subunit
VGEVDPEWRKTLLFHRTETGMAHRTRGVAEPSEAVREALDAGYELDYHHLE